MLKCWFCFLNTSSVIFSCQAFRMMNCSHQPLWVCHSARSLLPPARGQRPFLIPAVVCWRKWGSWLSGVASPVRPTLVCWGRLTLKLNSHSARPTFTTDTSEDTQEHTRSIVMVPEDKTAADKSISQDVCAAVMHSAVWGCTTLSFLSRHKPDPEST